ncbi:MAG TPA: DUF3103 family protein [Leadbetterella sp.]|nr:DUF3103 family protein [Leadbetterella sp.]
MDKEEYEDFAKEIARLLSEKDFRKILKEEANKKFDGDYDILFSNFKNVQFKSKKIEDFITSSNVARANEKLNISIPILIENWNESKQEPLVAVAIGVVEKETKFLKAFDSKGKSYILDANIEPNVPVIIIGNNERMNYKEEIKKNKSARTSGNYEKITWLKCPNLSDIESWYFGAPELRFDGVVYNNDFSAAFQAF